MPIIRNCAPGFVAPVEQLNADCACPPGIVSITNSANGLDEVFTLSDGTVWSVPKLPGEQGATGATGPAGTNGSNGVGLIWSDGDDMNNGNTVGSFVILKTGSTNYSNAANNLVNVGDYIKVHCAVYGITSVTQMIGFVNLFLNAVPLINNGGTGLLINNTGGGTTSAIIFDAKIILTGTTTNANTVRVEMNAQQLVYNGTSNGINQYSSIASSQFNSIQDIGSLNFQTANNVFTVQADTITASSVTARDWSGEKYINGIGTGGGGIVIGGQYLNDVDAASGGIAIGGFYINSATGSITERLT